MPAANHLLQDLVGELTKAHEIIRIALLCMHNHSRVHFIERVTAAGVAGKHGITRTNERSAVLRRARAKMEEHQ